MLIREATIADVPAIHRIREATLLWHTASLASAHSRFSSTPPEARMQRLVAEVDGQAAGTGWAGLNLNTPEPGVGFVFLAVHPDFRGRGVGSALLAPTEAHLHALQVRRAIASASEQTGALAWAQRRGWEPGMSSRFSAVDPRHLPPMPDIPPGVQIVDATGVDTRVLYDIDMLAAADEPGNVVRGDTPYELWVQRLTEDPDVRLDLSQVALVDGRPVAFTFLEANLDNGRGWSGGTVTHPQFRGRGLAKLLKSVSLRKAAAAGVTSAVTANDFTNKPMLAVNDWLGYTIIDSSVSVLKTFRN